jgi:hypothetical protein
MFSKGVSFMGMKVLLAGLTVVMMAMSFGMDKVVGEVGAVVMIVGWVMLLLDK